MNPIGIVYLLHFDRPGPGNAQHYIGWTQNHDDRIEAHRKGRGSKLTSAIRRQGIGFEVVRTWEGMTKNDERQLKKRHQAARLCPVCRPAALAKHAARERAKRKRKPK